ncbi:MAG: pyridoxal-phosphate dependent enzyme, partial [Lewinella sp.]
PKNVDFGVIDHFEKVTDKDGAVMARRLAREEGLLLGYSAGSAVAGLRQMKDELTADDLVVVVIHDHGSRYIGKLYNDDWMRDRGFLETELRVRDLIADKKGSTFSGIEKTATVRAALKMMKEHEFSQMPVLDGEAVVGSILETDVLNYLLASPMENSEKTVADIMRAPFPEIDSDLTLSELGKHLNKENPAVMVKDALGQKHLIAQYDILQAI